MKRTKTAPPVKSELFAPFGPKQPTEVIIKATFDDAGCQLEGLAHCIGPFPWLSPERESLDAISTGCTGLGILTCAIKESPKELNAVETWLARRLDGGGLTMECLWPVLAEAEPVLRALPGCPELLALIDGMLKGKGVMDDVVRFVDSL